MDTSSTDWEGGLPDDDFSCRYILNGNRPCGATRKWGSASYCAQHHALCYLTPEQAKEREREIEALARAVGGRLPARKIISAREMRRIERRAAQDA
jgi:hypothetical protein